VEDESLTPEMRTRLETSYARIAEDEGLTSALTDAEARELLAWAQAEVRRLAAQSIALSGPAAEADLAAKVAFLRRHLRRLAKAAANETDPGSYLRAHLAAPDYPEAAPAPDAALTFSTPAQEMPPAVIPEAPIPAPVLLPKSEPTKPVSPLGFLRRWFGKKDS